MKYLVTCLRDLPSQIGHAQLRRYKGWMLVNARELKEKQAADDRSWTVTVLNMVLFANLAVTEDASVLFHCKAGKHRSGAMAVLYLIWKFRSNPDVVKDYVRQHRAQIYVNADWDALLWAWYNVVRTNQTRGEGFQ